MAMVNEETVLNRFAADDEPGTGFWDGVRDLFSTGAHYNESDAESLQYERGIWDKRIEKFLDSSLPDYLHDFGILDEVALHVREERLTDLATRSHDLLGFAKTIGDDLTEQEDRLAAIEKVAKKKSA